MASTIASAVLGVGAHFSYTSSVAFNQKTRRGSVSVRAEGGINPQIRKDETKVVDSVVVAELEKPLTAYCRCWRSGTFPLCDGTHVKHNKATGDNVGPLLVKK
ncbi:CDGSH iron-sulfur domain-containing protein NEET [Carex littledalei]|uniref:CDGSH iron-sulfur domain-containing protein NEET n=1 Tax=Carex littledalei TaxID=544730 RepID=A0A833VXT5_9POAL|nr:CDGSH iron-sulfur domain-containing protein NEET [Carex littledalei]